MGLIILNIASLLAGFEKTFYTEPIMVLLNIVFLILALKHYPGNKNYRIFILYGAAALIQNMIPILVSLAEHTSWDFGVSGAKITDTAILLFIVIEFIVFYRFFYLQFEGRPAQRKVLPAGSLFLVLAIVCALVFLVFTPHTNLRSFIGYLSVCSSVFLLVPSFHYFYTLFTDPPLKNLLVEPSFWITTGIAFLHGLNIPIFLVEHYVRQRFNPVWFNLYTIDFIAYCFLFVLFVVGVVCDKSFKIYGIQKKSAMRLDKIF